MGGGVEVQRLPAKMRALIAATGCNTKRRAAPREKRRSAVRLPGTPPGHAPVHLHLVLCSW